jgi:hypothetical protein
MAGVYKVSFVVSGEVHPGAITNLTRAPQVGEQVTLGDRHFTVTEVVELLPTRGDFHFLHVTLRPAAA